MKQNDEITTNAYNFSKLFTCGIDERTSMYNMSFNLAELYSSGELNFVAKIGYNPLSKINVGFGEGWSLNISEYDIKGRLITLSDGTSFRIVNIIGERVICRYLKENKNLMVTINKGLLIITHKDGTIEEFDSSGKLAYIKSPSGHWHKFSFRNDRLLSIIDSDGKSLIFNYSYNNFSILDSSKLEKCSGNISNGMLKGVLFDDNRIEVKYEIINNFRYIKSVKHPTGYYETIYYKNDAIKLPKGAGLICLPGIIRLEVNVGGNISSTKYEHSTNNYLGYGLASYNKGYDTLYETKENYEYSCKVTTDEKEREITYNKYHLPVRDVTYDSKSGALLSEITTEYHVVENVNFDDQPNQYLKPKVNYSKFYDKNGRFREEVVVTEFDDHENISREVDKYGIEKVFTYYTGDELLVNSYHIPHLVKKIDINPSRKYSTGKEYSYSISYQYTNIKTIDKLNDYFVKSREIQISNDGTLIKDDELDYHEDRSNLLTFGLLKRKKFALSNKVNETIDYNFSSNEINITRAAVYFDGLSAEQRESYCRHTQKIKSTKDIIGNTVHYSYDLLGRIVEEIHDQHTDYEFIIRYSYDINERSMTTYRDDNASEKIIYDEKGRKKIVFKADVYSVLRKYEEYKYDAFDRILELKRFDYINDHEKSYVVVYEYDVWGKSVEIAENGLKTITVNNKYELSTTTYNQYQDSVFNKKKKITNEIGKVTYSENNEAFCQYEYDGFGELIKEIDINGIEKYYTINQYGHEVEQRIDLTNNIVRITSKYDNRFASNQEITEIAINDLVISSRRYDGLGRIKKEVVNGIETNFRYNSFLNVPNEVECRGKVIFNELDELAGLVVRDHSNAHKEVNKFKYDKKTKLILEEINDYVACEYEYYSNKRMKKETQHGNSFFYFYSSNGLLTRSVDYNGVEELRDYDNHGHLIRIQSDNYIVNITRDFLFRVQDEVIESKNNGLTVKNTYKYNETFGKVKEKNTVINGFNQSYQTYEYDKVGRLIKKEHIDNTGIKYTESYKYNQIGQLKEVSYSDNSRIDYYNCGYIVNQCFDYDILNNISVIRTSFLDYQGVLCTDTAIYSYDLFRLQSISHSFSNIHQEHFTHDEQGRQTLDSAGNKIEYDAHGRICKLIDTNEKIISRYEYSSSGVIMKQIMLNQDDLLFYYAGNNPCGERQGGFYSKNILMNRSKLGRCIYGVNVSDVDIYYRDYKNSITGIINKTNSNDIQYSAYGYMSKN